MKQRPSFSVEKFPASRQFTIDIGQIGRKKHYVQALIEVDVTDARTKIRQQKSTDPGTTSFNSWFVKCVAQAVHDHPQVHALRKGRSRRVIFDEVDIAVVVERELEGQKVPLPVVVRRANGKTLAEIHAEIVAAKRQSVTSESDYVLGARFGRGLMRGVLLLPRWIRLLGWKVLLKNPGRVKRMMGTVVVSSVGTAGNMRGWAIPLTIHPLSITLGSITKKPGVHQDQVAIREYLPITILGDHDVVDGMPSARFISRLTQLIEGGYHLP